MRSRPSGRKKRPFLKSNGGGKRNSTDFVRNWNARSVAASWQRQVRFSTEEFQSSKRN